MPPPEGYAAVLARAQALPRTGRRHLIAIAGPPASGKSTLAARLAQDLSAHGRAAQVVPMDGFHLDNRILDARGLRARKGAPETFDLGGFTRLVNALSEPVDVIYPLFDRAADQAVAGAGLIEAPCDIAVIEGNYLLYDVPGWDRLQRFWDFSIWIDVPPETLRQRLVQRWLDHGMEEAEAVRRAEENDLRNAATIRARLARHDLAL